MAENISINGTAFTCHSANTLIIGSGAAALNAAAALHEQGVTDIIIATDRLGGGTSNNAGSDKQTYYKLSLAGDEPDSPFDMARDLFAGGCMHGDIALCEANHSAAAFCNLVRLGVPFCRSRHGAFPGYRTDHDKKGRGTSAGPLTSRHMVTALTGRIQELGIRILDGHEIIFLFTAGSGKNKRVTGAAALDHRRLGEADRGLVLFNTVNVIMATGGPAGIYADSVYPRGETGSHGLAFQAGAAGCNLTESQFGLASVAFRWNLSGTYQQVMPRYISTGPDGDDEQNFLAEHFPDTQTLAAAIFLKGYQWPFDPRRIAEHGSSLIDLLVYRETVVRGRRVFLDFLRNPADDFSLSRLPEPAAGYLRSSGALLPTPLERLSVMNRPAIDLYRDNGIDLSSQWLEAAVCAQHNNGGLKANIWWESTIRHLFPVGELCGTHGVRRPGGSALNSGQVGGMRAAMYISQHYGRPAPAAAAFLADTGDQIRALLRTMTSLVSNDTRSSIDPASEQQRLQKRMSSAGALIRDPGRVHQALERARKERQSLVTRLRIDGPEQLPAAFKYLDLHLTHLLYLEAIEEYLARGGASRGSSLVTSSPLEEPVDSWRFSLAGETDFVSRHILEVRMDEAGRIIKEWQDIRPLPREDIWFETVYNAYNSNKNIY